MALKLKEELEKLLRTDKRLVDDNGDLRVNLIHEYTNNYDVKLIELLLSKDSFKDKFFVKIKDVFVFKQSDFKFFLDESKIDNSYTQYENKIGLSYGSKLLRETSDVVLNFPYKDCILEGGQSTEEGVDTSYEYDTKSGEFENRHNKRNEIFFNQILAKDEIDRLTEPKAFENFKLYSKKGEEKFQGFNRNEDGVIKDNLIIKGNNLLVLHSLQKEFESGIKMIYIDPPFYFRENKQEDTFTYNSNFRLSTWLTFMKNRLEIAHKLLKDDGVIFISINEDGLCYLKTLMDEIFKIENFIEIFSWKKTDTPSNLPHKSKKTIEYIICYEKYKDNVKFKGLSKTSKSNDPLTKPKNSPKILEFKPGQLICSEKKAAYKKGNNYGTDKYPMELLDDLTIENNTNKNKVRFKNRFTWSQDYLKSELDNKTKIFCSKKTLVLSYKKDVYELEAPFDLIDSSMGIQTSESAGSELTEMFGKEVFKYPKSESLIEYLINMVGNKFSEEDIVLDYHVGSGTTAAAAHKMGVQYIGIEQLDYVETITVPRLQKVLQKDKIGISEKLDWDGGGSFVFMELAKSNLKVINLINKAKSLKDLMALFDSIYDKYFLNYNVKIKEFRETICKEPAFIKLMLSDQKKIFADMLDLNQLYVNVSDMEDSKFGLTDKDIEYSKDFYQLSK